jgi:tetratricopeptide (TPR) repeat protein
MERAKAAAAKAEELSPNLPEVEVARGWVTYAAGNLDETIHIVKQALARKPDCESGYYLLSRSLFTAGRYQEVADIAEVAIAASGEDYNVFSPICNALGALGKTAALLNLRQRRLEMIEAHLLKVPEDARARMIVALEYALVGRTDEAMREVNLVVTLRPDESIALYNAACVYCVLKKVPEAIDALRKAWETGYRDANWTRRDPDLALLHGHPEFERLYPPPTSA